MRSISASKLIGTLIVSGLAIALGFGMLVTEPAWATPIFTLTGKPGSGSSAGFIQYAIGYLPLALLVLGMAGVVGAAAVILWSSVRRQAGAVAHARDNGFADLVAVAGCACAAAAVLLIVVPFELPTLLAQSQNQPCVGEQVTTDCLDAHPEFYNRQPDGSYTTVSSELGRNTMWLVWVAWPAALVAAVVAAIAIRLGTSRRGLALAGLILGSAVVVWLPAAIIAFWISGGGE